MIELVPLFFALILAATLVFVLIAWAQYEIMDYKYRKFNNQKRNHYGNK